MDRHLGHTDCLVSSADGNTLVAKTRVSNGTIDVASLKTRKVRQIDTIYRSGGKRIAMLESPRPLLVVAGWPSGIAAYDIESGRQLWRQDSPREVGSIGLCTQNGSWVVVCVLTSSPRKAVFLNPREGTRLGTMTPLDGAVCNQYGVAYHIDTEVIVKSADGQSYRRRLSGTPYGIYLGDHGLIVKLWKDAGDKPGVVGWGPDEALWTIDQPICYARWNRQLNGWIVVMDDPGAMRIHCVSEEGRVTKRARLGKARESTVTYDGSLLVCEDGRVLELPGLEEKLRIKMPR